MVQLKQIIAAILSDITRARAISDAYTKELSSSYREDPFLKLLSVPRTDIKEVTIDLKFAILDTGTILTANLRESKVVIYQKENYEGRSQELSEGSYDKGNLGIGDNQLSSLKVPKGIKVTIYQAPGFTGTQKSFSEDTPSLGRAYDGMTSSIKVEKLSVADIEAIEEGIEVEVVTSNLTSFSAPLLSSISIKFDMTSV